MKEDTPMPAIKVPLIAPRATAAAKTMTRAGITGTPDLAIKLTTIPLVSPMTPTRERSKSPITRRTVAP